jgi:hypothetical protein
MKFLSATWSNLVLATFETPEELLRPRLPRGLELDRRDGRCFVSLVAFDFLNTRVLRVPWPGYRHFPEINLRFYVRHGEQRGVVFVREFVPKRLIAFMARTLYNEPYLATPMRSSVVESDADIRVEHQIEFASRTHRIVARGSKPAVTCSNDSVEHFFKEHEWGFGVVGGHVQRYRVVHPIWETYPATDFEIDVDWAALYGSEWGFLRNTSPYSVVLAIGSAIEVYTGTRIGAA